MLKNKNIDDNFEEKNRNLKACRRVEALMNFQKKKKDLKVFWNEETLMKALKKKEERPKSLLKSRNVEKLKH